MIMTQLVQVAFVSYTSEKDLAMWVEDAMIPGPFTEGRIGWVVQCQSLITEIELLCLVHNFT